MAVVLKNMAVYFANNYDFQMYKLYISNITTHCSLYSISYYICCLYLSHNGVLYTHATSSITLKHKFYQSNSVYCIHILNCYLLPSVTLFDGDCGNFSCIYNVMITFYTKRDAATTNFVLWNVQGSSSNSTIAIVRCVLACM